MRSRAVGPRHGWYVVAALFLILTVNAGFGFYALSSYAGYLVDHNGLSLTVSSFGATVFMLASGAGGIFVARFARWMDLSTVMCLGALVSAVTLPLIGLSHHGWVLWLVYLVYGIGSAGTAVIPASTLVMRWFVNRPEKAIALATTGLSVGGALVAPLVAVWVDRQGLPVAGGGMAVLTLLVIVPLSVRILRVPPAAAHDPADTPELVSDATATVAELGLPESTAVRVVDAATREALPDNMTERSASTRIFVLITIAFGLLMLTQVGTITHILLLGTERSISDAAVALSVLAATSVAGRLAGIPLLPIIGVRRFTIAMTLFQAGSMVVISLAHEHLTLFAGACLLGLTVGNMIVLVPLWILELYGRDRYAQMYSRINLWTSLGVGTGPLVMALLHDAYGSYQWAFDTLACGSVIATLIFVFLKIQRPEPKSTAGRGNVGLSP